MRTRFLRYRGANESLLDYAKECDRVILRLEELLADAESLLPPKYPGPTSRPVVRCPASLPAAGPLEPPE